MAEIVWMLSNNYYGNDQYITLMDKPNASLLIDDFLIDLIIHSMESFYRSSTIQGVNAAYKVSLKISSHK